MIIEALMIIEGSSMTSHPGRAHQDQGPLVAQTVSRSTSNFDIAKAFDGNSQPLLERGAKRQSHRAKTAANAADNIAAAWANLVLQTRVKSLIFLVDI
ncbi:MAG TPA: hypothetical protein V6D46_10955 [Coleofasciculaceae cyanobacterium]